MSDKDIRWLQRLNNFKTAFTQLKEFAAIENMNKFEAQGLIQCFEYNYELAWNAIKDFYSSQGDTNIQGSRDAFRLAFNRGLIENGEAWMDMVKSRTLTSHTYNQKTADEVVEKILTVYFGLFRALLTKLEGIKE
ncbi:MAG: nucleotidyltransferase substrate binding protein [Bdellovibrionota bacterium]